MIVGLMFGEQEEPAASIAELREEIEEIGVVHVRRALSDEPWLELVDATAGGDELQHGITGVSLAVRGGEIVGVGGMDGNGQRALAEVDRRAAADRSRGDIRLDGRRRRAPERVGAPAPRPSLRDRRPARRRGRGALRGRAQPGPQAHRRGAVLAAGRRRPATDRRGRPSAHRGVRHPDPVRADDASASSAAATSRRRSSLASSRSSRASSSSTSRPTASTSGRSPRSASASVSSPIAASPSSSSRPTSTSSSTSPTGSRSCTPAASPARSRSARVRRPASASSSSRGTRRDGVGHDPGRGAHRRRAREGPPRRWPRALALTLDPCRARPRLHGDHPRAPRSATPSPSIATSSRPGPGGRRACTDTITRTVPILIVGCGTIVVFRAGLWNLGIDGQFLLAGAFVAGLGPWIMSIVPVAVGWVILSRHRDGRRRSLDAHPGVAEGALRHQRDRDDPDDVVHRDQPRPDPRQRAVRRRAGGAADRRRSPRRRCCPTCPGRASTSASSSRCSSAASCTCVFARTSFGTRLDVLGANARAAVHWASTCRDSSSSRSSSAARSSGSPPRSTSRASFGYMRADWNPAYGLAVVPLVFLARLNALALIPFAVVLQRCSPSVALYAAREARLPGRLRAPVHGHPAAVHGRDPVPRRQARARGDRAASALRRASDGG